LARRVGPKPVTVARSGTPPAPVSESSSTGQAAGAHSWASSAARAVSPSLASPAAPIPARSPFMSAANTGQPAAETCSAMSWRVRVLPVPVAPAMSPWRFRKPSGSPTSTDGSGGSAPGAAIGRPIWTRGPSKP
jgi:hypothetical protein